MKFLFELGIEEIPSRYVEQTEKAFANNFKKFLEEKRIEVNNIKSYSTPRRIAIIADIAPVQKDLDEFKLGPSVAQALVDGKATKALLGFLSSNGLKENEYKIVETNKGQYIQIHKFIKGKKTEEVLAEVLDKSIRSLEFEKSMKWSDRTFRFVRPIKWILALLDNKKFDFVFEGISSDIYTRGMRNFASQEIEIQDIDKYEETLEKNYVIADRNKRKDKIIESIKNNTNVLVDIDKKLLEEVVDLLEYPYAILGDFDKSYLELPEDLITITMKTHQRYFPVRSEDGKLLNNYVVIRNAPEYSEYVKIGNDKVIIPRLADSKFFFDEDLKHNLEDNVDKLKDITFQKDMGTIYDKMQRSLKIADILGANENAKRAIKLAKADLVSNVIGEKEFTGLQGMMGAIYALKSGENQIVSQAIEEHYKPRFQNDDLPKSIEGAISAISDKLDTAIGAFCVGLKPTGSKDPYAIRRATQGVVQIALDKKLDISYIYLIEKAYEIFALDKKVLNDNALVEFIEYFKQRLETILIDKYPKDLVSLIINTETNFKNIVEKLDKLVSISSKSEFTSLINLLKRMKNIVGSVKEKIVDTSKFVDKLEEKMYNLSIELKGKKFVDIIDKLIENEELINAFFENLKVISEDEILTANRLAIINNILDTVGEVIEVE